MAGKAGDEGSGAASRWRRRGREGAHAAHTANAAHAAHATHTARTAHTASTAPTARTAMSARCATSASRTERAGALQAVISAVLAVLAALVLVVVTAAVLAAPARLASFASFASFASCASVARLDGGALAGAAAGVEPTGLPSRPGVLAGAQGAVDRRPGGAQVAAFTPAVVAFTDSMTLPPPGSYTLDRIFAVPEGVVLDSDGSSHRLADFTTGKVTLFAFVYTACSDARGCPLALATMHTLKAAIAQEPQLRERVRFVSMSFDPEFDTPVVMRSYGGIDGRPEARPRWHFLTTASQRQLAPLLAGFGQDVGIAAAGAGAAAIPATAIAATGSASTGSASTGSAAASGASEPVSRGRQLSHLLKIYLVDRSGMVREIYSPAFLQEATMLGDIRSLAQEQDPAGAAPRKHGVGLPRPTAK